MVFEIYGSPQVGHTESQLNPLHTLTPCFFLNYAIYRCPVVCTMIRTILYALFISVCMTGPCNLLIQLFY